MDAMIFGPYRGVGTGRDQVGTGRDQTRCGRDTDMSVVGGRGTRSGPKTPIIPGTVPTSLPSLPIIGVRDISRKEGIYCNSRYGSTRNRVGVCVFGWEVGGRPDSLGRSHAHACGRLQLVAA